MTSKPTFLPKITLRICLLFSVLLAMPGAAHAASNKDDTITPQPAASNSESFATTSTALQPSIVERCTRIVNDYAWFVDHPTSNPVERAQDFANLFTKDAELTAHDWAPDDEIHIGRKAIADYYLAHYIRINANVASKHHTSFLHFTSNIRVTPLSDHSATGTSYASVIFQAGGEIVTAGMMHPDVFLEYHDEYRFTAKGCKFSKRRSVMRMFITSYGIEPPTTD